MTSTNSQIFSAIAVTSENIPESNMNSIDATYETAGEGLFLLPSENVPGRTDITGFLVTSSNDQGKMEWTDPNGFLSLNDLSDVNASNPSTNQILAWSGAYWEPYTLTASGVINLNGLTAIIQSFAVGTSGSDFNISSVGSVHTYNLPDSSATTRGALTSADWTTFNNKLSTSLTDSYIFVGDATNVATGVLMSGDGTLSNTGVFSLSSVISGNKTFNGTVKTRLGLIIEDPGAGTNTITVQAPTLAASYTLILPVDDGTSGQVLTTDGSGVLSWTTNGSGDVIGPISSTDNAMVRFNGTTGKSIQNSGVILDDTNNMLVPGTIKTQTGLIFEDPGAGSNIITIQAPTLAANYVLKLPVDDGTLGQLLTTDGGGNLSWTTNASGDVVGPASATDNAIVRYDGTTGKLIQNSGVTIDDFDNLVTDGMLYTKTSLVLEDPTVGTNIIVITAPDSLAANYTLTLPANDGNSGQVLTTDGSGVLSWITPAGSGDVVGPASATDNTIVRYDGTTGKLIQNSGVTIDDTNNIITDGSITTKTSLIIEDPTVGTNTVTIVAPTLSADYTLTLPDSQAQATGILENDGTGSLSWKRNNFAAGADPTTGNDTTQGYSVGSQWINTTDDFSFTCVNNSTGAAIWNFQSTYRLIAALQGIINGYNTTTTATSIPLNSVIDGTASTSYSGGLALVDYDPFTIRSGNVYTLPTTGWYQLNCFITHPVDKILGAGSQNNIGSLTLRLNINSATGSSYMATAGDSVSGIGEGVTSLMTRYFNSGTTINYIWDFTTSATNEDFILSIGIYKL